MGQTETKLRTKAFLSLELNRKQNLLSLARRAKRTHCLCRRAILKLPTQPIFTLIPFLGSVSNTNGQFSMTAGCAESHEYFASQHSIAIGKYSPKAIPIESSVVLHLCCASTSFLLPHITGLLFFFCFPLCVLHKLLLSTVKKILHIFAVTRTLFFRIHSIYMQL